MKPDERYRMQDQVRDLVPELMRFDPHGHRLRHAFPELLLLVTAVAFLLALGLTR